MRYVSAQEGVVIPLGRQGENLVQTVRFSTQGWADTYGVGSFELIHKRNSDTVPYPVDISIVDGSVEWVISGSDTQFAGRGCAQLNYIVNNAIAKSVIYATSVIKSIDGGDSPPEPWQSWVDEVLAAGAHALTASSDAEAWAVGTRDDVPVPETDETWHNNSEYYADRAMQVATANGYAFMWIDNDGILYLARSRSIEDRLDFSLTPDGILEVHIYE